MRLFSAAVSAAVLVVIPGAASPARAQQPFEQRYPFPPPGTDGYTPESDVKINVTPNDAAVYVDGYYAGRVDDFDGPFQRLHAPAGDHEIVVYLKGHRALRQRLNLSPRLTSKVSGMLEPLGAGEPDPGPPTPPPVPQTTTSPEAPHPGGPPGGSATTRAGLLAIRVQPGDAELFIDGQRWEASPGDQRLLVEVTEGRHVVEIRRSGYRPFSTEVVIRPRQTTPLNVSLTKE